MTTTVQITAHLFDEKEVHVLVGDELAQVLQNGESATFYAYGDRVISVKEVEKAHKAGE